MYYVSFSNEEEKRKKWQRAAEKYKVMCALTHTHTIRMVPNQMNVITLNTKQYTNK